MRLRNALFSSPIRIAREAPCSLNKPGTDMGAGNEGHLKMSGTKKSPLRFEFWRVSCKFWRVYCVGFPTPRRYLYFPFLLGNPYHSSLSLATCGERPHHPSCHFVLLRVYFQTSLLKSTLFDPKSSHREKHQINLTCFTSLRSALSQCSLLTYVLWRIEENITCLVLMHRSKHLSPAHQSSPPPTKTTWIRFQLLASRSAFAKTSLIPSICLFEIALHYFHRHAVKRRIELREYLHHCPFGL